MNLGEPSATARRVAAHRQGFDREPAHYGDPVADDLLAADLARGVVVDEASPMATYLRARTRFFDRVVVDGVQRGFSQVVVVGAGYDARSLRYASPGVAWFEVDHPDTQRDKLERLRRLEFRTGDVRFVAADFRDGGLAAKLGAAGCDRSIPALFICEGVASYLDEGVLELLLVELRLAAGTASELAISLAVAARSWGARRRRARLAAAVRSVGEPLANDVTADEARSLLDRTGWHVGPAAGASAHANRRAGFLVAVA